MPVKLLLGGRMALNVATTSLAVSGEPSLNFRPSRSLMVHDSLSADGAHEVASCGSSFPAGLSMISPALASPTRNIVLKLAVVSGSMVPSGVVSGRLKVPPAAGADELPAEEPAAAGAGDVADEQADRAIADVVASTAAASRVALRAPGKAVVFRKADVLLRAGP